MKKPFDPVIDKQLIFDPDWVSDPVPPWFRNLLDDRQLRQLFQVKLDKIEANLKTEMQAVASIRKIVG